MRRAIVHSVLTAAVCGVIVAGLIALLLPLLDPSSAANGIHHSAWIVLVIAVVTVGVPVLLMLFSQRDRLQAALKELSEYQATLERAHRELNDRTLRDDLTGVLRRNAFFAEVERLIVGGDTGSLLILDADHLKKINESFGHFAGDDAIAQIAEMIRRNVRREDVIGRLGGEEFALFLPGADAREASMVAERIRRSVETARFEPVKGTASPLTVSVGGTALWPQATMSDVMRVADHRLTRAKNGGRNKVVVGPDERLAA